MTAFLELRAKARKNFHAPFARDQQLHAFSKFASFVHLKDREQKLTARWKPPTPLLFSE